jgi:hypothetical protein
MQPFTSFRATIKRLVCSGLEPARAQAFRAAFPGFLECDASRRPARDDLKPERRRYSGALFAVGPALPRARYATVCVDGSGEDGDGLCRELRAYAVAALRRRLFIYDLGRASSAGHIRRGGWSFGRRLGLHFDDPDRTLYEQYGAMGSETRVGRAAWRTHLEFVLEEVCFEDTVDLRLPDTQEWFFETFRNGFAPFWRKRQDPSVQRFHDMLPTLMTAELGGNAATDAVGRVLRRMGARALVYPAARSDPDAIVHLGTLRASVGFNVVEFGGTRVLGDAEEHMVFDDPEPWGTSVFWPRLRCEVAEVGKAPELGHLFRGSWRLHGVREAHERFWQQGGHLGPEQDEGEHTVIRARVGGRRTVERVGWHAALEQTEEGPGFAGRKEISRSDPARAHADRADAGRARPNGERGCTPSGAPGDLLR